MTFETLVQQPESLRDERWEAQFLDALIPTQVILESDEAKPGPDGWPYFHVRTSALDVPSEGLKAGAQQSSASTGEPIPRLVQWLAGRGIGLVINAHKMVPDYVFTYGMLWNFVETGRFVIPPSTEATARPGAVHTTAAGQLLMGPPTEKYLPLYVRSVLREFLVAQGYAKPKILVLSSADFKQIDLAFSLESLNSPPAHQHKLLAEAISWFLPLHYNLVLASEKDLPEFFELK